MNHLLRYSLLVLLSIVCRVSHADLPMTATWDFTITLDNEAASAHFPFNNGTEGQTATFSNENYFLTSKITHGDGLILEGKDNKSLNQTWFNPVVKDSKPNEGNAINFIITPKPGLMFTA